MKSQSQQVVKVTLPRGRVVLPGIFFGSIGLGVSLGLQWMGMLRRADGWLFEWLREPVFGQGVAELPAFELSLICAAVLCYGIAYALLDSAEMWRKTVLGVTALVICVGMVPAFAVWNIYFSPFLLVVGVFWSWFCVVLYAQHHLMPYSLVSGAEQGAEVLASEKQRPVLEEEEEQGEVVDEFSETWIDTSDEPGNKDAKYRPISTK